MRKIDRNPFPFAVWPNNKLEKAGTGEIRNSNQLSVEFIDKYIQYSSSINDVILDPFGGSYSTGFSAIGLGRRFIGFELNPFAHDHFGTKLMQECRSAKEKEDDIAHSGGH